MHSRSPLTLIVSSHGGGSGQLNKGFGTKCLIVFDVPKCLSTIELTYFVCTVINGFEHVNKQRINSTNIMAMTTPNDVKYFSVIFYYIFFVLLSIVLRNRYRDSIDSVLFYA